MGKEKKLTKLTLEALIARHEQRDAEKAEFREIEVSALGGALVFKKLPLTAFLNLMEQQGDNPTLRESVDFEVELIYKSCPTLQDKKLQAEYECEEPTDIVYRLLDDNLGAIGSLSAEILDFYGMGESVREQLKNG